jgi:hypothetical protein
LLLLLRLLSPSHSNSSKCFVKLARDTLWGLSDPSD